MDGRILLSATAGVECLPAGGSDAGVPERPCGALDTAPWLHFPRSGQPVDIAETDLLARPLLDPWA